MRIVTICAAAASLVLGAACQPAPPPPPPPPPERVTFVATLERDVSVGRHWRNSYLRANPECELREVERRLNVSGRSTYNWRNDLIRFEGTLHAGSQIEFSVLDLPWCSSNSGTTFNGRTTYGPPVKLEVADDDYNPKFFRTVWYYDGLSIPK